MNAAMSAFGVDIASTFLHNCNVKGQQPAWRRCWEDTPQVLQTLAEFSFMTNLHKCKFLVNNTAILGLELNDVGLALKVKFMGNLHKVMC